MFKTNFEFKQFSNYVKKKKNRIYVLKFELALKNQDKILTTTSKSISFSKSYSI